MKYTQIIISGKVQDVFFREFIRKISLSLGLCGYVRNTKEGSVEVVVAGKDEKINKLISECKKGPLLADVKKVNVKDIELDEEFDGFYIRHS